jgi:hypothetical protein
MIVRRLPTPNAIITVKNVDARVLQRLTAQAGIEGMSRQAWIRRALVDFLHRQDPSINSLRGEARRSGGLGTTEARTLMTRHADRFARNSIAAFECIERSHPHTRGLSPLPSGTLCLKGIHPVLADQIAQAALTHQLSEQEFVRQVLRITAALPTPREEIIGAR